MMAGQTAPVVRSALIVDDMRFSRTLLRHTLISLGYSPTEAADGQEAIKHLNATPFDLIFLDWELPGTCKGDQLARLIRSLPTQAGARMIAITSDASPAMRLRCAEAGAHAFLGKALDARSVQTVLAALERRRLTQPAADIASSIQKNLAGYAGQLPGGMPEALRQCREELRAEQQRLHGACTVRQWPAAARAVHNLGALSAIIGLSGLHECVRHVERVLRAADSAALPDALAQLDQLIENACQALILPSG